MYTIKIDEEIESKEELCNTLEQIVTLIRAGNTSGFYPAWELIETPDEPETDES